MTKDLLKKRTQVIGWDILDLMDELPNNRKGWTIGDQICRSSMSVGANYRSSLRGRSEAEFISKLGIVIEEADETQFWLEAIKEKKLVKSISEVDRIHKECDEVIAMLTATIKTIKSKK